MKKIETFKKCKQLKNFDGMQYSRKLLKGTQYVSIEYARGFNAAVNEMMRLNK